MSQLGCHTSEPTPAPVASHQITQISVINALMLGQYDGVMSVAELLRYGGFGVGTLDGLDGELIILDGKAYQVGGDGVVSEVGPGRTTPFAVVTHFEPDGERPCPSVGSLGELDSHLDQLLRRPNNFLAVRVDGRFAAITVRSIRRQDQPYKPLGEVAKGQSVWTHADVRGTLVGIRSPTWVRTLNVPGYHWHFISQDRAIGGHVLDCRTIDGLVRYEVGRDWMIKLGDSAEFNKADLGKDFTSDLRRVESSRGDESKPADPKK